MMQEFLPFMLVGMVHMSSLRSVQFWLFQTRTAPLSSIIVHTLSYLETIIKVDLKLFFE